MKHSTPRRGIFYINESNGVRYAADFLETLHCVRVSTQAATVAVATCGVAAADTAVEQAVWFTVVTHLRFATVRHGVESGSVGIYEESSVVVAAVLGVAAPHEVSTGAAHGITYSSEGDVRQCANCNDTAESRHVACLTTGGVVSEILNRNDIR